MALAEVALPAAVAVVPPSTPGSHFVISEEGPAADQFTVMPALAAVHRAWQARPRDGLDSQTGHRTR